MIFLIGLLSFLSMQAQRTFTTLDAFAQYAHAMPEYPANDTDDWENPDYTTFHRSLRPSLLKGVKSWLGFSSYRQFDIQNFKSLLREIEIYREGVYSRGRLIEKVTPVPESSFIIWGELNGAFHSLVRCLQELERQGVIDNDMNIIQPITYFVFNGNVVSGSPYIIETLTLILELMKKNPKHVFYLKGDYEDKQRWMNHELGRELSIRARDFSDEKIPFVGSLRNFFGTLPLALYLIPPHQTDNEKDVVRISFFNSEVSELDESDFTFFFDIYSRPIVSLLQKTHMETEVKADVKAYIFAEDRTVKYTHSNGLVLLNKNDQNTQWSVVSSPTASFRRLYQFFNDAFVVLKTAKQLSDWTLTLYHQDVRKMEGFVKERPFYLISGQQIEDEQQLEIAQLQNKLLEITKHNRELKEECVVVQQKDPSQVGKDQTKMIVPQKISALQDGNLVIGSTMDLSKQLKGYSKLLKQGLDLPIDAFNKTGGLDGIKVQMVYLDDGYEPEKARANVEKLLNEFKTNVLLSPVGTPTAKAYLDLVREKKILSVFSNTGSFHFHDLEYMIHLKASYIDSGRAIARHVVNQIPKGKIALFYQNDTWGYDLIEGVKKEFKKVGLKTFLELPYERNTLSFKKQAEAIVEYKPNGIGFFCTPKVCEQLIKELGADFLISRKLFGDAVLGKEEFEKYLKRKGLQIDKVQVVPNPRTSEIEIVQDFRKYAEKNKVPIDTVSLEGYMNAVVFLDILQKAERPISIKSFLNATEKIKDYDFKGLRLNFNPNNRQLLHTVWLNTGSDDWKPVKVHYDEDSVVSEKPDISDEIALQGDKLVLGSTMDLSRALNDYSELLRKGLSLPIDLINQEGGISGLRFKLVFLDDGYDPVKARKNIETFINDFKTDIIFGAMGSPTLENYLDLIKEKKILSIFPNAGSSRDSELKNLVHLRVSYVDLGNTVTEYVKKEFDLKRFAFFYQNDAWGQSLLKGAKKVLSAAGIKEILEVPYERNTGSFADHAKEIELFEPQAIGLFGAPAAAQMLLRKLGNDFLYDKKLFGDTVLGKKSFKTFLDKNGLNVIVAQVVPNPWTSDLEIVRDFRNLAEKVNVQIDTISLEGYITSSVFLDLMAKLKGSFTKEKFLNIVENIKDYNFKGLKLNFDPSDRQLLHSVWMNTGSDDWQEVEVKKVENSN